AGSACARRGCSAPGCASGARCARGRSRDDVGAPRASGVQRAASCVMKVLCVHPSGLLYNEIFLRLEPLGLELVAAAVRNAGHDVRLLDLQAASHRAYHRAIESFRPDAVLFGMNYLANLPEVVDLCK